METLFGVPQDRENSKIIIMPVPWEVTTSYGGGTSQGPDAILRASPQIDLYDIEVGEAYKYGYFLDAADPMDISENTRLKKIATDVIAQWDENGEISAQAQKLVDQVNAGTTAMVERVRQRTRAILAAGKIPALIGGDHSTPLGLIQTLCEAHQNQPGGQIGVLHMDAHADLREAYHGFVHSHASIMRNVMELPIPPAKLVQVGIRDFCREEYDFIQSSEGRIRTFFDREMKTQLLAGENWDHICRSIVAELPEKVYLSFDIDGLSPEFCPHTGTPVPGGLSFDQAMHLLRTVGQSGKTIVGFDLNEVAPDPESDSEWDGNVGSRMLFKMCGWTIRTNGLN